MSWRIGGRGHGSFGPMSGDEPGNRGWNRRWGREYPQNAKPGGTRPELKRPPIGQARGGRHSR